MLIINYGLFLMVPPTGIEPISQEPESCILSIELQGRYLRYERGGNSGRSGKTQVQRCNFFAFNANTGVNFYWASKQVVVFEYTKYVGNILSK